MKTQLNTKLIQNFSSTSLLFGLVSLQLYERFPDWFSKSQTKILLIVYQLLPYLTMNKSMKKKLIQLTQMTAGGKWQLSW